MYLANVNIIPEQEWLRDYVAAVEAAAEAAAFPAPPGPGREGWLVLGLQVGVSQGHGLDGMAWPPFYIRTLSQHLGWMVLRQRAGGRLILSLRRPCN
jgi:hypothetical protein